MTDELEIGALELLGDGGPFHDELHNMIERAPMFNRCSHAEVETLTRYMRGYLAKKGITIFEEGSKGLFMCIVVDGRVSILKQDRDETSKKVATVRAGKSLGEMSLLDELPYSATAKAEEDTTLLLLTKMGFERLAKEHPMLCNVLLRQIARLMSLRLRQTTGILLDYISESN